MKNIIVSAEDAERIEMLIFYYNNHGVKHMTESRPGFVIEDFTELLTILARALDIDLFNQGD